MWASPISRFGVGVGVNVFVGVGVLVDVLVGVSVAVGVVVAVGAARNEVLHPIMDRMLKTNKQDLKRIFTIFSYGSYDDGLIILVEDV